MKKGKDYDDLVAKIKAMYAEHSNPELSKKLKVSVRRIKEIAKHEKLRKDKETISRIKSECGKIGNDVRWHH